MTTLRKRDVEAMMTRYEYDPLAALTDALRVVLDLPQADWPALLDAAGFTTHRRRRLEQLDQRAFDELLTELNELRGLTTVP